MSETERPDHSAAARVADFLALERNVGVLLLALLVIGLGEELWSRFVPKYLEALGASALIVGVYGTLKDSLDAVYQYPGGALSDRLGRRLSLVLFNVLALFGYALYLVSRHWLTVLIGTVFVMAWSSLSLPATFALLGDRLPVTKRAMGFAVQSILKRVPMAVAPVLGGAMMGAWGVVSGVRVGLAIGIVLALVAAALQFRLYTVKQPEAAGRTALLQTFAQLRPRLKGLLFSECFVRFGQGMAEVFVVLYAMNIVGVTATQFGLLTAMRMVVAMALYIPIARIADQVERGPLVVLTFGFFALFPLAVGVSSSFAWLAVAFVIAGLREIGEPARKALIVDLTHEERRGTDVGVYYLVRGLAVAPAGVVGGLIWRFDPRLAFLAGGAISAIGMILFAFGRARRAENRL